MRERADRPGYGGPFDLLTRVFDLAQVTFRRIDHWESGSWLNPPSCHYWTPAPAVAAEGNDRAVRWTRGIRGDGDEEAMNVSLRGVLSFDHPVMPVVSRRVDGGALGDEEAMSDAAVTGSTPHVFGRYFAPRWVPLTQAFVALITTGNLILHLTLGRGSAIWWAASSGLWIVTALSAWFCPQTVIGEAGIKRILRRRLAWGQIRDFSVADRAGRRFVHAHLESGKRIALGGVPVTALAELRRLVNASAAVVEPSDCFADATLRPLPPGRDPWIRPSE